MSVLKSDAKNDFIKLHGNQELAFPLGSVKRSREQKYSGNHTELYTITFPEGASAEIKKITRAELRSLANASNLEAGCIYCITDYAGVGCLAGQVEGIMLSAVNANTLSFDASVLTTFDNEAWEARYDIGTNRIVELHDNLGNKVGGRTGVEVNRFAWGKNLVRGNRIFNADVYMDCDTTQRIEENSWSDNSYTDLRGFQGIVAENRFDSYSRVYLNGAQQVDFRRNKIQSYAYIYLQAQTNIYFRQNTIADNSYIRKFGGNRWTLVDSLIARGDVRHYNGTLYMNSVDVLSSGRIYANETTTTDIRYTTVSDNSYLDLDATGGITRIWYSSFKSLAYYYVRAGVTGGNRFLYYTNVESSQLDYRSGSANIYWYYHKQMSNGYHRLDNVTGNLRMYQNTLQSRGEMRFNTISGNSNIYYNTIASYQSAINLTNCSGTKTFYYNSMQSSGRLLFTAMTGTLSFQHNNCNSYGQGTYRNSAGNFTVLYNNYNSVARITFDNCAGTIRKYGVEVSSRAEIDADGLTGTHSIYYSSVQNYRARIRLNGTSYCYIYSYNLSSNAQSLHTGGRVDIRNSSIESGAQYITNNGGTVCRLWNSSLSSLSRLTSQGYTYCSTLSNRAIINAVAFNLHYTRIKGIGTFTLGANNSNRYIDYGTSGLI